MTSARRAVYGRYWDICRGRNGTGNYTLRPVIHVINCIQPLRYNFDGTSKFDDGLKQLAYGNTHFRNNKNHFLFRNNYS